MINEEIIIISDKSFIKRWNDEFMIRNKSTNILYDIAIDLLDLNYEYEISDVKINE